MAKQISTRVFDKIQQRCKRLEEHYSSRNTQCDDLENIFLMKWEKEKPEAKPHIKFTVSPNARIRALGAIRLLTAADPKFSVPYEKNDREGQEQSSKIEKAASALWYLGGRIRQSPIHHDMVTSSVVFGEIHASVNSTEDILNSLRGGTATNDQDKKAATKSAIMRAERIAAITPYSYDVYDPRTCFADYDNYGLSAYYRKVETTAGVLIDRWGMKAIEQGLDIEDRFVDVTYCEYWDSDLHITWIHENDEPLWGGEHGLITIPIVAQIVDGSNIFSAPEEAAQPFLYTYYKGSLAERENLALTVMYSNIFALASNPTFVEKLQAENRQSTDDFSVPGGKKKLLIGEDYYPLQKNAIDPAIVEGWKLAQDLGEASTIHGQALGEPLGANAPYSMVSLLSQAGRLPLVTLQRRTGWAIGKLMEITMQLQKDKGQKVSVKSNKKIIELESKDIPDDLIVEATLKLDLPQDTKSNIQMALAGTQGDNPPFAMETVRREMLGIDQSDDETEKIWQEKFAQIEAMKAYQIKLSEAQLEVQKRQAQMQAEMQQQMQPQQPPMMAQQTEQDMIAQQQMMAQQQQMEQQQMMMAQQQQGLPPMEQIGGMLGIEAQGAQEGLPQTEPEQP